MQKSNFLKPLITVAGQAGDATFKFQVQEHHGKFFSGQARAIDKFVHAAGIKAHMG